MDSTYRHYHIDTFITLYDRSGWPIDPHQQSAHSDSIILLLDSGNFVHQLVYMSDSTRSEVFTYRYTDSVIKVHTFGEDSIMEKYYYKNDKLFRSETIRSSIWDYRREYERTDYSRYSPVRKISITHTSHGSGWSDSIRTDKNKLTKIDKVFAYNKYKHEWYVENKIRERKNVRIVWTTWYHDYSHHYFTTKTVTKYVEGLKSEETVYNVYRKELEKKTIYKYEYY
ncbi:MAG: hypothetical protein JSS76_11995 [Bacteroidetes bacterium]|nr:hypothetical protein [Bacteroidota bacterium]